MAHYGKHGSGFGKLGGSSNYNSSSQKEKRIPAYSSAYSGAAYVHFIQEKK
jgi:hypothetical protein